MVSEKNYDEFKKEICGDVKKLCREFGKYKVERKLTYSGLAKELSDGMGLTIEEKSLERFIKEQNLDNFVEKLALVLAICDLIGLDLPALGRATESLAQKKLEAIQKILDE